MKTLQSQTKRKELALVTLVDLLVQIVFVFTLVILVKGSLFPTVPEKTVSSVELLQIGRLLVEALNTGKTNPTELPGSSIVPSTELATKVKERLEVINADRAALATEMERLTVSKKPPTKEQGPGLPNCKNSIDASAYLFNVEIAHSGNLRLSPTKDFLDLVNPPLDFQNLPLQKFIDKDTFKRSFNSVASYGANQNAPCKYLVYIQPIDPSMSAGEYQNTMNSIEYLFRRSFK